MPFNRTQFSAWLAKIALEDVFSLNIVERMKLELSESEYSPILIHERKSTWRDFGPRSNYRFEIEDSKRTPLLADLKAVIKESLSSTSGMPGGASSILILLDEIDGHYHEDPLKKEFLGILSEPLLKNLFVRFTMELGKLDWKGEKDICAKPGNISECRQLLREITLLHIGICDLSELIVFLFEYLGTSNEGDFVRSNYLTLPPILQAQIILRANLEKSFGCDPYEFLGRNPATYNLLFAYILTDSMNYKTATTSSDFPSLESVVEEKWDEIGNSLFTSVFSHKYRSNPGKEEGPLKQRLIRKVAEKTISLVDNPQKHGEVLAWINAPKDLLPLMRCYSRHPNPVRASDVDEKGFHSFIVISLAKAFKSFRMLTSQLLVDSSYISYFPLTPHDAEVQELFAHIMWGLCVCEEDVYKKSIHIIEDVLYSAKSLYYGEFEAIALAEATSTFFALILLASSHFANDKFFETPEHRARAQNLVKIFLSTVGVSYAHSLASVAMPIEEDKVGFLGEKALVLYMLKVSKQKPGLHWIAEIREMIEQEVPIQWPWA